MCCNFKLFLNLLYGFDCIFYLKWLIFSDQLNYFDRGLLSNLSFILTFASYVLPHRLGDVDLFWQREHRPRVPVWSRWNQRFVCRTERYHHGKPFHWSRRSKLRWGWQHFWQRGNRRSALSNLSKVFNFSHSFQSGFFLYKVIFFAFPFPTNVNAHLLMIFYLTSAVRFSCVPTPSLNDSCEIICSPEVTTSMCQPFKYISKEPCPCHNCACECSSSTPRKWVLNFNQDKVYLKLYSLLLILLFSIPLFCMLFSSLI